MRAGDERVPRRQVRFEEDDNSDSDGDNQLRPRIPGPDGREQGARQFSEKPAAYQREPDRGHGGHNHLHNHGPTVDPALIKMLTYKEVAYPMSSDVITLAYGILMVVIAYVAFHFRESIIIDELYEKFQASREKFVQSTSFNVVKLIPEAIKFFSMCAYDILIIMYLIKPLKGSTKLEREVSKQYQDLLKRLNGDRSNAQENIRRIETLQAKKNEMVSHRYTVYNASMLEQLKAGLSVNFILATLGLLSFFVTSVSFSNLDGRQGPVSDASTLLRNDGVRSSLSENGFPCLDSLQRAGLRIQKDHGDVFHRYLHFRQGP